MNNAQTLFLQASQNAHAVAIVASDASRGAGTVVMAAAVAVAAVVIVNVVVVAAVASARAVSLPADQAQEVPLSFPEVLVLELARVLVAVIVVPRLMKAVDVELHRSTTDRSISEVAKHNANRLHHRSSKRSCPQKST